MQTDCDDARRFAVMKKLTVCLLTLLGIGYAQCCLAQLSAYDLNRPVGKGVTGYAAFPSSVQAPSSATAVGCAEIYSLTGCKASASHNGLHVVRQPMSDGTVKVLKLVKTK